MVASLGGVSGFSVYRQPTVVALKRQMWGLPWTTVVQGMPPGLGRKVFSSHTSAIYVVLMQGFNLTMREWGGSDKEISRQKQVCNVFLNQSTNVL